MTTNDFFLVERASQIQRLRAAKIGNHIEVPGRVSRMGYSSQATGLFRTIDQICRIPLGDKRKKWLAWLTTRGGSLLRLRRSQTPEDAEPALLNPKNQLLLNAFETQLVQVRLEEDTEGASTAEAIIQAILNDQQTFAGLKPLQFHSDAFAYEFLFPSWLNLYTALVLPQSDSPEPRSSREQIRTIFRFLQDQEKTDANADAELLGALTQVANRLGPAEAQPLIQRIIDLVCLETEGSDSRFLARLARLREETSSADEFLTLLKHLTLFETCALGESIESKYPLCPELPRCESLPQTVTKHVEEMEQAQDGFAAWMERVSQVACIVDGGGCIEPGFAKVIAGRKEGLGAWLALLTAQDGGKPLSGVCQRLLTRMIQCSEAHHETPLEIESIRPFAHTLAPRLDLLDKPMAKFFEKEFVARDSNRELLLSCTEDVERRRAISRQLVAHAKKADDRTRLLSRLTVAAILDPEHDQAKLVRVKRTLVVLRLLQEQGFISSNQLEEFSDDIRNRLPESLEFLAAPFLGASEQSGRLAKLYLALYEECEKYEHSGETGNFGLTSAAYGNLNRTIDRET